VLVVVAVVATRADIEVNGYHLIKKYQKAFWSAKNRRLFKFIDQDKHDEFLYYK